MGRGVFNVASTFSLLLLLASGVSWVRSRYVYDRQQLLSKRTGGGMMKGAAHGGDQWEMGIMNTRHNGLGLFFALLVLAVMGCAAWGNLVIDLRLPASVSADPKHLELTTSTPSSVEVDIFARITGAAGNSAPESFRSVMGSFKTPDIGGGGALRGSILPFGTQTIPAIAPFNDPGSSRGASLDLDGDGDLDLGSFNADAAANFVSIRTGNLPKQYEPGLGTPLSDGGVEFLIGRLQLDVTSILVGQTEMNYYVRRNADGTPAESGALWFEDSGLSKTPLNGNLLAGAPIVFSSQGVPEPTSVLLVGCMLIGIRAFHRTLRSSERL
jgi:hypothetical protein